MITLALYKQMIADDVADLEENTDFFWEELPLQNNGKPAQGAWLVTRGGDAAAKPKGHNLNTTVDIYVTFGNKVKTEKVLATINKWILDNPYFCELDGEASDGTEYSFSNVRLFPTTTPQNAGVTENGSIVKVASILIYYNLN